MKRFASSLVALGLMLSFVWCGGDSTSGGNPTVDPTSDGGKGSDGRAIQSNSDGSVITPGSDGSTVQPGTDGSTPPSPDPAWTTAPLTSGGCGMAAGASPVAGDPKTIVVGGVSRDYLVYVPAGYDPNRAYPVVFVLHGIQANGTYANGMAGWIKMQEYSAPNAIVVFPSSTPTGQPDGSVNWDVGGDTDLNFFDAMVKTVEDTLCVNERRIFALGFSWGTYMVNHLACRRSDTFRAVVAADGGFYDAPATCGKTTMLVYHRTEDDNENISMGVAARDKWLGIDGCAAPASSQPLNDFGFNVGGVPGTAGCVTYDGCPSNTTVSWCEDQYVSPYKHDLRDVYRVPMWNWFNHF